MVIVLAFKRFDSNSKPLLFPLYDVSSFRHAEHTVNYWADVDFYESKDVNIGDVSMDLGSSFGIASNSRYFFFGFFFVIFFLDFFATN